jgi:hypothetical protein
MKRLGRSTRSGRVRKRQGCRARTTQTQLSSTTFIVVSVPDRRRTQQLQPALICVKADLLLFSRLYWQPLRQYRERLEHDQTKQTRSILIIFLCCGKIRLRKTL